MSIDAERALSRRSVLGLGAGIATASILAGCSTKPRGPHHAELLAVPDYVPARVPPGALVSKNPLVPRAFDKYPEKPYTSVPKTPGSGGTVTVYQVNYGDTPPSLSTNKWWQQLDKNLGTQWNPTLVPVANYGTKVSTMLAGGNIPDISWIQPDQQLPAAQAVQQGAFVDLTDVLKGDGIKAYPNLAALPTRVWKHSSINGSIYGIPLTSLVVNQGSIYRADWAEKLGYPNPPANSDEVLELFTAFSKGKPFGNTKTWAIAEYDKGQYFCYDMFGVPTNWRLEPGGKFVPYIDTDEYEACLVYLNKMWKADVFHPEALLYMTEWQKAEALYTAGRVGFYRTSLASWLTAGSGYGVIAKSVKGARAELLVTPGVGNKPAVNQLQADWWGISAISSAAAKSQKRLEEILRILDYWAAPFGSKEYAFLNFGIKGRQYTIDKNGRMIFSANTEIENEKAGNYLASPSDTLFFASNRPNAAKIAFDYSVKMLEHTSSDPTMGLFSESYIKKSMTLGQLNGSYEQDIITGRKPLSALKELRRRWHSQGGDKIAGEYEDALQQSKNKKTAGK